MKSKQFGDEGDEIFDEQYYCDLYGPAVPLLLAFVDRNDYYVRVSMTMGSDIAFISCTGKRGYEGDYVWKDRCIGRLNDNSVLDPAGNYDYYGILDVDICESCTYNFTQNGNNIYVQYSNDVTVAY